MRWFKTLKGRLLHGSFLLLILFGIHSYFSVRFYPDQTFVQYSRALRGLVNAQGLDLRESARLLGYVHVSIGDTMIACWEAKYYYYLWRPNHAIQRAGTDGNPATFPDPTWLPLVTGNHPEYPSGHASFTAAVTNLLVRDRGRAETQPIGLPEAWWL